MSNQKSPFTQIDNKTIMNPNDYVTATEIQPKKCSPLRHKSHSPARDLLPSITSAQLQEKIKNSCDKLASALGLPNNLAPVAHGVRPQSASFNDYNMILHPIQHNQ